MAETTGESIILIVVGTNYDWYRCLSKILETHAYVCVMAIYICIEVLLARSDHLHLAMAHPHFVAMERHSVFLFT